MYKSCLAWGFLILLLYAHFSTILCGYYSGGLWTCPYAMESIATLNWAMGKTGYYPKGYIPPAAIMKSREEREQEPVRDPEEVFKEMENSTLGQDMPQCVKDRLDFL